MTLAIRTSSILVLALALAAGVGADQAASAPETTGEAATTATTATTTATTDTAAAPQSAVETLWKTREEFGRLLGQHPSELGAVLGLDPTLLSNEPFLARYPEVAQFVAEHPEIRRNPHYYTRDLQRPRERREPAPFEEAFESLSIVAAFALIAYALGWFIRTVIEQKRWNALSRRQSEVHNKILERFGTSSELLEYIKTPAGEKFLESAPIPLHAEKATQNAPLTRVMWSVQLGVVLAAAGLGTVLVSARVHSLFAIGMIGFFVGAGFIASALVSIFLSRRLGVWHEREPAPLDDSGFVR